VLLITETKKEEKVKRRKTRQNKGRKERLSETGRYDANVRSAAGHGDADKASGRGL
jgi:hypothetical protein